MVRKYFCVYFLISLYSRQKCTDTDTDVVTVFTGPTTIITDVITVAIAAAITPAAATAAKS